MKEATLILCIVYRKGRGEDPKVMAGCAACDGRYGGVAECAGFPTKVGH